MSGPFFRAVMPRAHVKSSSADSTSAKCVVSNAVLLYETISTLLRAQCLALAVMVEPVVKADATRFFTEEPRSRLLGFSLSIL